MEISFLMHIRVAELSDIPKIAKVHVDTWKDTYRGIVSDDFLRNLTYKWSENNLINVLKEQNDKVTCFIAESTPGNIIGFAIGGLEKSNNSNYKGELWGIYIGKESQRKGVGKLLVLAVVDKLLRLNINSMLVWVLKENPYRAFYKLLGGKYIEEKTIEIGQEKLIEVAYGWDNLRELFALLKEFI